MPPDFHKSYGSFTYPGLGTSALMSMEGNLFALFVLINNYIIHLNFNITSTTTQYSPPISSSAAKMVPWVSENFLAILSGLHQKYINSKGADRTAVINDGVKQITASAEKDGVAIPPSLKKVRSLADSM
jgi:hypothetical protein